MVPEGWEGYPEELKGVIASKLGKGQPSPAGSPFEEGEVKWEVVSYQGGVSHKPEEMGQDLNHRRHPPDLVRGNSSKSDHKGGNGNARINYLAKPLHLLAPLYLNCPYL